MKTNFETANVFTNNENVKLVQINFRGVALPAYIFNGVLYENRDNEPAHFAIKDWHEISTAKHNALCKNWKFKEPTNELHNQTTSQNPH